MSVTSVSSVIVEIRAAEGGEDAKSLVDEQLRIYAPRSLTWKSGTPSAV